MTKVISLSTFKRVDIGELPLGTILEFRGQGFTRAKCAVISLKSSGDQEVAFIDESTRISRVFPGSVHPHDSQKGIGYYYPAPTEKAKLSDEELKDLIFLARQAQQDRKQRAADAEILRKQNQEKAKQWFLANAPKDAKAIIVAEMRKNESDPMSDYFNSKTVRTVLLGFSSHTRDLFSEMRKLAANFSETAHLVEPNPEMEHREKYSMGAGYYLGEDSYSGWIIQKRGYVSQGDFYGMDFVNDLENVKLGNAHQAKSDATTSVVGNSANNDIQVVDYSEKAIAVFGNTKPFKDQLKALDGRFNPRLKNEAGDTCAGWIFSKKKADAVRAMFNIQ